MNSNNKIIAGVIGAVVVIGIVYVFYIQPQSTQAPDTAADNIPSQSGVNSEPPAPSVSGGGGGVDVNMVLGAPMSATVIYDGTSFSPATITIKQGGTVSFIDKSGTMWLASAPHPAHSGYDGTNLQTHCAAGYVGPKPFDECSSGSSFSFVFGKIGSWRYHDHLNASSSGTVVVIQ